MAVDLRPTLDFLRDLRANNRRDWFEAHRADYDVARTAFNDFVQALIDRFDAVDDLGPLVPDAAMYRLNRDVRFSKDKTPYKTSMSALLAPGGRKATITARAYYVAVEPSDASVVGTGLFPPRPVLDAVRAAIATDAAPLRRIVADDAFRVHVGALGGDLLKTAPKSYPKDHPAIDLLRHNTFMATATLTDEQVLSPDVVDHALTVLAVVRPLAGYFSEVIAAANIDPALLEAGFR